MNKKVLLSTIIISGLLTSCNQQTLRSDIAKFIASFSLENAVSAYQEAGYEKIKTVTDDTDVTVTTEYFDFNIKDVNHPTYQKRIVIKVNDVQTSDKIEYISDNLDNTFTYHKSDDTTEIYSLEQAHGLIQKFFYTSETYDSSVYDGGMYAGDIIKNNALKIQNYIVINEEEQTLKMEYDYTIYGVLIVEKEIVDSVGIMKEYETTMTKDALEVKVEIETYNI